MTCGYCGGEFTGHAKHYGWYVTHPHESECAYVFRARETEQRQRAEQAEAEVERLKLPHARTEGVYGIC